MINRQWRLARRPVGAPVLADFELVEAPIPACPKGGVLARTLYQSLDPYMRGRMSDAASYTESVALGGVMVAECVGEVLESDSSRYQPGDKIVGPGGWQSHWAADARLVRPVVPGFPRSWSLGLLGMPGMTAYVGLMRIGQPKPGETLAVAAASGAVGSVVGQIGKRLGLHVVGIAGGAEKCRYVEQELGFDAAIDHKAADFKPALKAACLEGIDIYFENVGGPVFEAVLPRLNPFARIPLCGLIAQYNATGPGNGIAGAQLMTAILVKRLHVEGFIVTDYWQAMAADFERDMARWIEAKPFVYKEDVVEGLEQAPAAFIGLLEGRNFGKLVVKVAS